MKKHIYTWLLALMVLSLPFVSGCFKVGDEDPFVSLRTRKARMIGDWTVKNYTLKYTEIFATGTKKITELTFSGSSVTKTVEWQQTAKDTIIEWKGEITEASYEFDDDGEMEFYLDYEIERDSSAVDEETEESWDFTWTEHYRLDYKGTWNFLDKIDNYKNKERITFVWTTFINTENYNFQTIYYEPEGAETVSNQPRQDNSTQKFANGEVSDVWKIVQLRKKEIKK